MLENYRMATKAAVKRNNGRGARDRAEADRSPKDLETW
jgi:hypothetical protein